jgi:hypothetical protein
MWYHSIILSRTEIFFWSKGICLVKWSSFFPPVSQRAYDECGNATWVVEHGNWSNVYILNLSKMTINCFKKIITMWIKQVQYFTLLRLKKIKRAIQITMEKTNYPKKKHQIRVQRHGLEHVSTCSLFEHKSSNFVCTTLGQKDMFVLQF